jgi:hypothetical protein
VHFGRRGLGRDRKGGEQESDDDVLGSHATG